MGKYKLYVSEDGENWTEAGEGEFTKKDFNLHQEGDLHNVGDVVYGNFDKTYKLYVSEDGENWTEAGEGEFTKKDFNLHQEGDLHNVGDVVYGNFDKTYESRYIRIDQLSDALGNTQEFSGAEINLFSDKYEKPEEPIAPATAIKSSDLTLDNSSTKIEDIENAKIDYFDLDHFVLEDRIKYTLWSHPDLEDVTSILKF